MPDGLQLAPTLQRYGDWGHSGIVELRGSVGAPISSKMGAVPDASAMSVDQAFTNWMLWGASSTSGIPVNESTAMGIATVYACVDVLAQSIGSIPLNLYRRTSGAGSRDRELAYDHPLFTLLHDSPNEEMTSCDFRKAMQANLSLHNGAYAVIRRNGFGEVVSLTVFPYNEVEPRRVGGQLQYKVAGEWLHSSQVIHLRGTTFNGVCSPDLVHTVRNVIGLAAALDLNLAAFFKNGSFPGGFVETPAKLTPEAINRLASQFSQSGGNSYRVKVLEQDLKYREGRTANRDAQLDETRDRQDKQIARVFRLPGHKVGIIGNQPRANVEQENISFVTDTLRPICVTWEQELNMKLLTPQERGEYYFEFNLSGLLRGDLKARYEAYNIGRNGGWLSVNEIRRMENLNSIGDAGDIYLQPLNMTDANANPNQPLPDAGGDSEDE